MNTVGGLAIHLLQVHKTELTTVENCIPGRNNTEIEIFGMEGVPLVDLMAHKAVSSNTVKKQSHADNAPRADMHQNTDELVRQLQEFREKKALAAAAPVVKSSAAVVDYAPQQMYSCSLTILGIFPLLS